MTSPLTPHRTDGVALSFGLAFLVIGAAALSHEMGWVNGGGHLWAGVIIAAIGVVGFGSIATGLAAATRRMNRTVPAAPAPSPTFDTANFDTATFDSTTFDTATADSATAETTAAEDTAAGEPGLD